MAVLVEQKGLLAANSAMMRWASTDSEPFHRAALEILRAAVILPIRTGSELVAFLSLGPKRSGDVYTRTELSWLAAVADKVAGELVRIDYAQRVAHDADTLPTPRGDVRRRSFRQWIVSRKPSAASCAGMPATSSSSAATG
jgi:hypothetical protein